MSLTRGARTDRRGVVLLVVLFFALLLSGSIAAFLRRSTVDALIARNRDAAARAEAIARGGVRLAEALLLEDRLLEDGTQRVRQETLLDPWARASGKPIELADGTLRLEIEDSGARLNLNALFELGGEAVVGALTPRGETETFLVAFFERVIDDLPIPPGERALYDPQELTDNLIDWVDGDDERQQGGPEDDYYQRQDPPYRAYNQRLMSVDELRLIEGFDDTLVEGLRPYVTVYPFAPGGCGTANVGCGINLNTAPPHVLALLYYDDGVDVRLAPEDVVRDLLKLRQDEMTVCAMDQSADTCTPISEVIGPNPIFPPPTVSSEVFLVTAEARVGEIGRRIEAVVDRSQPAEPRLLSWRVR